MIKLLLIYLLVMNIITFALYGIDKSKARQHQWRIPERTLLLLPLIGGPLGAYLGMTLFRRKTQHNQLKEITLDGFPQLEWLFVQENPLKGIAIPKGLTLLNKLHVEDCALTACQLDSLYTSLPEWKKPKHDDGEPVRLYNHGQGDQANKASTSTTSIATAKHWTVAAEGDGSGCQPQGIETLRRGHGFNYYSDRDALVIVLSDELRQIPIRLFNVNGHNLFRGERQKEYRIDLRTGQYILTVGNESFKIVHQGL